MKKHINQPGTMNTHEKKQPVTKKNQPGTLKNNKAHLESRKTNPEL